MVCTEYYYTYIYLCQVINVGAPFYQETGDLFVPVMSSNVKGCEATL